MLIRKTNAKAIVGAAIQVGVRVDFSLTGNSRGGGQTFSVKVSPGEDRERWRRVSRQGRRIHAVCWHGFRDFFRALYEVTPLAVCKTMYATYDGIEGFEETFPATGWRNIGSSMYPLNAQDACICGEGSYYA